MEHETVKSFWDEQAKTFRTSDLATAPDTHYRSLEIKKIIPYLSNDASVMDIGCGNGFGTIKFAEEYRKSKFLGVDFSEEMIKQAIMLSKTQRVKNTTFTVGSILELDRLKLQHDIIICCRTLINLPDWESQKRAIMQMRYALNPGGRIILVENTIEGLANLNKLRAQFKLPAIPVRWHNKYLPQQELTAFLKKHFKILNMENIGNLYYIISRVVYAKLCQDQGTQPEYSHAMNEIASELPSLPGYHYSPNFLFVLRAT